MSLIPYVAGKLAGLLVGAEEIVPKAPPGAEKFLYIASIIRWGSGIVCIVGMMIVGVGFVLAQRSGEGHEQGKKFGLALIGCVIVGVAGQLVSGLIGG